MIQYYQEIRDGDSICSIDMVRLSLDFSSETRIQTFGDWLSNPCSHIFVEMYPLSTRAFAFRHLFKITCSNNCSFVIGLSFNGVDKDSYYRGFMEFNPNKVAREREFREVFSMLQDYCFCAEISRWDLAVDVNIRRDRCVLRKDKRSYHLFQNSLLDKDEKLGQRNKSGYVKLYNKTLESDLDYDDTRLEITVDGKFVYDDFVKILPRVDVRGDQQNLDPYVNLSGTDLVLYELLMRCDLTERREYLKRLGRRKAEILKPYVQGSLYDSDKFVVSKETYRQLKIQLREWTIGIKYSLLDDIKEY